MNNLEHKINLHTHTIFCDGKNSAEEMVLAAIEKGFEVLGFSSHSLYPFARSWHIAPRDFQFYETEILRLKEAYKDKIKILLGYEGDYYPGVSIPSKKYYKSHGLNPDYLIGSVHYIVSKKGVYSVDNKTDTVRQNLIQLYGDGEHFESVNAKKAVCEYFAAEREMLKNADFEILGHPDLIRLRNTELHYFDEGESWYKKELKATVKAIKSAGIIVEINTGAIGRKLMDDVYPSEAFLELLYEEGIPICINADSHQTDTLDSAFDFAKQRAKKAGYRELVYPAGNTKFSVKL